MRVITSAPQRAAGFRWSLFIGIILIGACLRAPITSVGPVLFHIEQALHLDAVGAGLLNAIPLLMFSVLSLVAPAVGRRHGPVRVLAGALAAIALGTVLRSLPLAGAIWIGSLALSAGIAFANVLLPGLVKKEFPGRAAGLIGLYAATMAGTAGLASGLAVPIASWPGLDWRWSIGAWALLAFLALAAWLPQLASRGAPAGSAAIEVAPHASVWKSAIGWQVSLFFALLSVVFYATIDWYPSYAGSVGISPGRAGTDLLVYQLVAVAANLGCASLIKRTADQVLLGFACGLLMLIGSAGLLFAPAYDLVWMVCSGLSSGMAMVTALTLFTLRTRNHHQAAELSGMAQFIGYLGGALGALLVGALHQLTGAWLWPLAFLVACSALVMVFAALAGRRRLID